MSHINFFLFLFFTVLQIFDCHLAGRRVYALECGVYIWYLLFLLTPFDFVALPQGGFFFF